MVFDDVLKNDFDQTPTTFYLGLPIQTRDYALGLKDSVPKSDVNKEYYTQNMEREVSVVDCLYDFIRAMILYTGYEYTEYTVIKVFFICFEVTCSVLYVTC